MKKFIALTACAALLLSATPAMACWGGGCWRSDDTTINVSVSNVASVTNDVETEAETGDNDAYGGDARNYIRGGKVTNTDATGGDADVDTGEAVALSTVYNDVNYTKIKVSVPCDDCDGDMTANVRIANIASLSNDVETEAETGDNDAFGGDAKNKIKSRSTSNPSPCGMFGWFGQGSNGVTDTQATGGDADIDTGDAYADSLVTNYVNTTMVRIRR